MTVRNMRIAHPRVHMVAHPLLMQRPTWCGEHVEHVAAGDSFVGLARAPLASRALADARLIARKPDPRVCGSGSPLLQWLGPRTLTRAHGTRASAIV